MKVNANSSGNNIYSFSNINETGKNASFEASDISRADTVADVTISDRGLSAYRESVQRNKESISDLEREILEKASQPLIYDRRVTMIGFNGVLRSMYEPDQEKVKQALGSRITNSGQTVEDKAKNLFDSYTVIYDEIMQGYKDGTREVYWTDESGKRKLTQEEELEDLQTIYEDSVKWLEYSYRQGEEVKKDMAEFREHLSTYKNGKYADLGYEDFIDRRNAKEQVPENLPEKMTAAARVFREQYAALGLKKGMTSKIFSQFWKKA